MTDAAWLEFGCVLHRALQCEDENATEAESLNHVLWYHPASDGARERLKRLSLLEGLIALAGAVAPGDHLDGVALKKSRWCVHEPEPGVWLCWAVRCAGRDGPEPLAAQSLLVQSYDEFALCYGSVSDLLRGPPDPAGGDGDGLAVLRELAALRRAARKARRRVEDAVDREDPADVLRPLEDAAADAAAALAVAEDHDPSRKARRSLGRHFERSLARVDASRARAGDDLAGFEHRSLGPGTFLEVHALQRRATDLDGVRAVSVLLGRNVVWNGIGVDEMAVLYRVLLSARDGAGADAMGFAAPRHGVARPADGGAVAVADEDGSDDDVDGQLWCPPLAFPAARGDAPHAAAGAWWRATRDDGSLRGPDRGPGGERLLVYLCGGFTVGALIDEARAAHAEKLALTRDALHVAMHDTLKDLDLDLALRAPAPRAFPVPGVTFVYFNRGNLSLKAFEDGMPRAAVDAISDMHVAFLRDFAGPPVQEEIVQLPGDEGWVVGKKNDKRLLFLHLDGRYPSLHDVCAVVDHLKTGLLSNIRVLP